MQQPCHRRPRRRRSVGLPARAPMRAPPPANVRPNARSVLFVGDLILCIE